MLHQKMDIQDIRADIDLEGRATLWVRHEGVLYHSFLDGLGVEEMVAEFKENPVPYWLTLAWHEFIEGDDDE